MGVHVVVVALENCLFSALVVNGGSVRLARLAIDVMTAIGIICSLMETWPNMKILWHGGITRVVILVGKYAIKVPQVTYGWKMFLYGFLGNVNEQVWSDHKGLCPVLIKGPLGLFNVMPLCRELTDEEFSREVSEKWGKGKARMPEIELKSSSFGYLGGKIVAIDYGGYGWEADRCQKCGHLSWKGKSN